MSEIYSKDDVISMLKCCGIPIIDETANYWFVRTSGGENFNNFFFQNYIAIGWDKLNEINALKASDHSVIKEHVEKLYPDDLRPGSTASQIKRFVSEMKPGDYVFIPSSNCDHFAFGIIKSDAYVHQVTNQELMDAAFDGIEISFLKRRDVDWIVQTPFVRNELDPMLIPIIYSYGTIIDANPYSGFINRTIYDIYYRNGELHSIFNIGKRKDILAYDFYEFINNIFTSMDVYSEISSFKTDKRDLSIKASINSPGPVEIITCASSLFIFLAAVSLFLNGADVNFKFDIFKIASGEVKIQSDGLLDKINKLRNPSKDSIDKISSIESNLNDSKEKLKITKKKKKK